jgi:hypothetical protein
MTSKEKAKEIWDKFELPPLDMTCSDSLHHSEILVNTLLDFIGEEFDDEQFHRSTLIDYYQEVLEDLKNIYRFKRYEK